MLQSSWEANIQKDSTARIYTTILNNLYGRKADNSFSKEELDTLKLKYYYLLNPPEQESSVLRRLYDSDLISEAGYDTLGLLPIETQYKILYDIFSNMQTGGLFSKETIKFYANVYYNIINPPTVEERLDLLLRLV